MNREDRTAALLKILRESPGEETAWKELYVSWWPYVLAQVARELRGQRWLAEEAAQEVFLRLVRYCPFDDLGGDPAAFRAYLRTVCRNTARTCLRRIWNRPEIALPVGGEELIESSEDLPGSEQEARDLFEKALEDLSPDDRTLIRMLIDGESLPEIAGRLGVSYSAAAVRVHRLRRRIRQWLMRQEKQP